MQRSTPNALSALVTPDLAQLGLLYEVISDIRYLDQPGLPDAAYRSGVRHAIEERLPPPPVSLDDWPTGRLPPGSTAADAAGLIYGHLRWCAGPATRVLSEVARAPVTIEVARCATRRLAPGEARCLDADEGAWCYEREGFMTAGTVTVAQVRLLLIQNRIPGDAWESVLSGKPAGEVLEPYGMTRDRRQAEMSRADATVDASAVLKLGALPVGVAEEHVGRGFCEHVAAMAGASP
jgi:hypothetical protein